MAKVAEITDITYKNKKALRGKFSQQGRFPFQTTIRRPKQAQLRLFERIWRQDTTIKAAITARTLWLLNTIGEIEHPDPEIAKFLNDNIKQLEDVNGKPFKSCLQAMVETKYWAGASVSEVMFDLKFGSLYLHDILTYHPTTITLYTNKLGRLVEGETSYDNYHDSGIWQMAAGYDMIERQLSLWKHILLTHEAGYGNYYGYSIIEPSYTWVRLKEALIDMMASALDKLGKRMMWVRMPSYPSNEIRVDPSSGEEKAITTLQLIMEQFEEADETPEVIFLPYQQAQIKPEVGSETLQDPIGDLFMQAIDYADAQSIKHIMPNYLISTTTSTDHDPIVRERQMELFTNNIEADRAELTTTLIKKILMPIIQFNFSRKSAQIQPSFARVYSDRTEDRVATMQMIKGLVEAAILNPRNVVDYTKIMQMLRLGTRERDQDDIDFIQEMLITPREKTPRVEDVGPNGSGSPGRRTGSKSKQIDKKTQKVTSK